jgi:hypothetical protein
MAAMTFGSIVREALIAHEASIVPEALIVREALIAHEASIVREALIAREASIVPKAPIVPEALAKGWPACDCACGRSSQAHRMLADFLTFSSRRPSSTHQ